jgi:chromosomal replication initiation ATPase DnaA
MASRSHRSPREVEGLRQRLARRGLLEKLESLCKEYNVLLDAVLAGRRNTRIVQARDACICKILKVPMSTTEVGELFGMDHSSITSARQRYEARDKGRLLT